MLRGLSADGGDKPTLLSFGEVMYYSVYNISFLDGAGRVPISESFR